MLVKVFHVFIFAYYRPVGSLSHSLFARLIPAGAWVRGDLAFLHTFKISIAFANRSVEGSTIALAIHSLDPSGAFRGWCAGDLYRPP